MRRLLVLALLLPAPTVRAAPEASPELAALVPAQTLLLVEGNDLDGKGRFGPDTAMGKLLAEPDVRRFLGKLEESFRNAYAANARQPLAMFGLAPEDFHGIAFRRAGFALVDVAAETRQVDAVLYLETRRGGDKVHRILRGLRQAAETFAAAQFREEDVRGRKVLSTAVEGHELCICAQGERFVLTTRRARMDDVLKALDDGHGAPLAAAPRAARLRERMGAGRNALFAYADAPALGKLLLGALRYEAAGSADNVSRIASVLGLDAVEAIGFADIPVDAGYRTEAAILLKERRGLFALAAKEPPSHRFAAMTPADAIVYGGETADLALLWDQVLGLAGGIDAGTRAALERGAREGGAVLGIDLRRDLLEALGTEWAGYVAWPPGGGILPDVAIFATVRDRARLERTLDAIADKVREFRGRGATVTSGRTEFRGREIRFLELTNKRGEPRPYVPAWAFGDDFVVFGICPQTVKHALMEKGIASDAGTISVTGLGGSIDFRQLLAAVPKGASSVTYIDLGRVVSWCYAAGVPFLQVAQSALNRAPNNPGVPGMTAFLAAVWGVRFNFEDLPTADVIARHLKGMACYTAVGDDCFRTGYVSQVGAPLAAVPLVALAGLGAAAATRARVDAAEQARAGAEQEARRAAEAAERAAAAREAEKLRAENAMLRERLARLEQQVAELLRETEEEK